MRNSACGPREATEWSPAKPGRRARARERGVGPREHQKDRQAAITREIIEVVSGTEAL